eukprot:6199770-Pleurochrysis_carterae.AAC.7
MTLSTVGVIVGCGLALPLAIHTLVAGKWSGCCVSIMLRLSQSTWQHGCAHGAHRPKNARTPIKPATAAPYISLASLRVFISGRFLFIVHIFKNSEYNLNARVAIASYNYTHGRQRIGTAGGKYVDYYSTYYHPINKQDQTCDVSNDAVYSQKSPSLQIGYALLLYHCELSSRSAPARVGETVYASSSASVGTSLTYGNCWCFRAAWSERRMR